MTVGTTTHISLGGHEYILKPASYIKRRAPDFGPRFSTGDPDFNNLSMWQHWAQRCFIGGTGQEEFSDDAMYFEGVGVDTSNHEKVFLARDLLRGSGSNWAVGSGASATAEGYRAIVYNNALYVLGRPTSGTEGELWKYDPSTDGWTRNTALDAANIEPRCITAFDGKLFIGGSATTGTTTGKIVYASGALSSWTTVTNPSGLGATSTVTAMRSFQQKLYVAYSYMIWRMKDDQTWDGSTLFYKANLNSESSGIVAMETHLGFLYMLSDNGHIHRTDGNATFDIWSWDGQTQGRAIRSFDGRLFIMTFEYTNTAETGEAVLYQMSGSAVTQLKRWGRDANATIIPNMRVFDRKLWYGASNLLGFSARDGFGVAQYDPIEDAHHIFASNEDTATYSKGSSPFRNFIVEDVIFFNSHMFAFVRGHGAFKTPYKYRDRLALLASYDITKSGASLSSQNGGWFTTSTYDAGTPGVKKLWRKIAVDVTIKTNTGIVIEYSIDNGTNWTAFTGISTVGTRQRYEFFLSNVVSTSIKLRVTLRSTSASVTPEFWGFVVSYIPVPEPNWLWTFTIVLASSIRSSDNTTTLTFNTESEMSFLEDLYRAKQLTTFIDIDGVTWASNGPGVLIHDIEFRVPFQVQPLEGEVVVTLLEAVETY